MREKKVTSTISLIYYYYIDSCVFEQTILVRWIFFSKQSYVTDFCTPKYCVFVQKSTGNIQIRIIL